MLLAYAPFLERGYTVFSCGMAASRNSRFRRSRRTFTGRFVSFATMAKWQVNPDKLGISGGSAGGHLSLTMGVYGGPWRSKGCRSGGSGEQCDSGHRLFLPADGFPQLRQARRVRCRSRHPGTLPTRVWPRDRHCGKAGSGLAKKSRRFTTSPRASPPTFIIHGDQDKLVPLQQAESFRESKRSGGDHQAHDQTRVLLTAGPISRRIIPCSPTGLTNNCAA